MASPFAFRLALGNSSQHWFFKCLRHWLEVERDPFCVQILKSRQLEGFLPNCPVSLDVVDYKPSGNDLEAELVTAGFPCQAESFVRPIILQRCIPALLVLRRESPQLVFKVVSPTRGQDS